MNISNPFNLIQHANPTRMKEMVTNFNLLFNMKKNDARIVKIKLAHSSPLLNYGSNVEEMQTSMMSQENSVHQRIFLRHHR